MKTIDPKEVPVATFHSFLLGAVTPRPIALASTMDKDGNVNLSPFSFFNCFGANPPVLIFSPSRRIRDKTTKHTYENVKEVPEVVIHIVNYSIVQQTSLASTEYAREVDEFQKAGFTPVDSVRIRPPRVKESPIAMECKVLQIIETGTEHGAGNLVLCEVLLMHVSESVLTNDKIDPYKLDAVSRLGGEWYARINYPNLFTVPKPLDKLGIGIDQLPDFIRQSDVLTGNDLGKLANVQRIPQKIQLPWALIKDIEKYSMDDERGLHHFARRLLEEDKVMEAWQVLLFRKDVF